MINFKILYENKLNEFDMAVNPFLNTDLFLLTEDSYPEYLKVNSIVDENAHRSEIIDTRNHSYARYVEDEDMTEYTSKIFLNNNITLKCSHKLSDDSDILIIKYVKDLENKKEVTTITYNKMTDKLSIRGNMKHSFGSTDEEKRLFLFSALEFAVMNTKYITVENLQDDGYSKVQCFSNR